MKRLGGADSGHLSNAPRVRAPLALQIALRKHDEGIPLSGTNARREPISGSLRIDSVQRIRIIRKIEACKSINRQLRKGRRAIAAGNKRQMRCRYFTVIQIKIGVKDNAGGQRDPALQSLHIHEHVILPLPLVLFAAGPIFSDEIRIKTTRSTSPQRLLS